MAVASSWAADRSRPLLEQTVGDLLAERAASSPSVTALVGTAHNGVMRRLTYSQLHDEAQRVAGGLAALTEPGDLVALWAQNLVEWPVVQYAAALAGVVLVALNPALRASELEYALNHSGSTLLLHADRSRDYDLATVAHEVRERCPSLRAVISLADLNSLTGDLDPARLPTDPDSAVMLQYTSGTTGKPKGVLLRHRALVNVARLTLERAGVAQAAVAVCPLPMFHTAGCVISTLGPLIVGGTMVLIEQFNPQVVLDQLRGERASVLFFVPAVLSALLEAQRCSREPAPRLRTVMGGAATISSELIQAAEDVFGAPVINLFGQTELSPVLTATSPDDTRADQLGTVGRPLPQVDLVILDPTTRAVVPVGMTGEICARGYQVMSGYLHDPDATAEAIDAEGFLHTGDLGSMDERGYLTVKGRLKELIIRGGENISPMELEECLARHPAVAEAAVFGVPDDRLGETVAAAVVLRPHAPSDVRAALVAHCREHLAPHKTPVHWYVVNELPRTPTGKVQKFRLAALAH
jgi:fatty-acyl-CoA synthase